MHDIDERDKQTPGANLPSALAPEVRAPEGPAGERAGKDTNFATVQLPLTAALVKAGLSGLSLSTPGHRGGRLYNAWEIPSGSKVR